MADSIKVQPRSLGGLVLTSATDPGFDEQLKALFGRDAALVSELKPYLASLSNESSHTVIAYTILLTVTPHAGVATRFVFEFRYPNAAGANRAMPRGREIAPGERRVFALSSSGCSDLDPSDEHFVFFTRQFAGMQKGFFPFPAAVKRIELGLDAVIYEDGTLIGQDTAGLAGKLLDELRDKRELYKQLLGTSDPVGLLRSLFRQAHYDVYLKGTGQEGSQSLPDLDELLKRQDEIPFLRQQSICLTHSSLQDFGGQRLVEAMEGALRDEELVIRPAPARP